MKEETTASSSDKGGVLFIRRRKLSRVLAMQYLYDRESCDEWSGLTEEERGFSLDLARFLAKDMDDPCDSVPAETDMREAWSYANKLVTGVCGCREELDGYIGQASMNWKFNRIGSVDRAILRMAVYEMLKIDKVSIPTAINEAVELAKAYGQKESPQFINGVLDRIRAIVAEESAREEQ